MRVENQAAVSENNLPSVKIAHLCKDLKISKEEIAKVESYIQGNHQALIYKSEHGYHLRSDETGLPCSLKGTVKTPILIDLKRHCGFKSGIAEEDGGLGEGSFHRVTVGIDVLRQEFLAVRTTKFGQTVDQIYEKQCSAKRWMQLIHPNIVKCLDYFIHTSKKNELKYTLLLEYVKGEDLLETIKKSNLIRQHHAKIVHGIISGLEYAHLQTETIQKSTSTNEVLAGLVHPDLKPDNVLVTLDGEAKICDWDGSRHEGTIVEKVCGTPLFIDPNWEVQLQNGGVNRFSRKSNVYQMGIIIYAIYTRIYPESAILVKNYYKKKASYNNYPCFKENYNQQLMRRMNQMPVLGPLIAKTWHLKPEMRPTMSQLRHFWEQLNINQFEYETIGEGFKLRQREQENLHYILEILIRAYENSDQPYQFLAYDGSSIEASNVDECLGASKVYPGQKIINFKGKAIVLGKDMADDKVWFQYLHQKGATHIGSAKTSKDLLNANFAILPEDENLPYIIRIKSGEKLKVCSSDKCFELFGVKPGQKIKINSKVVIVAGVDFNKILWCWDKESFGASHCGHAIKSSADFTILPA